MEAETTECKAVCKRSCNQEECEFDWNYCPHNPDDWDETQLPEIDIEEPAQG